MMNLLQNNTYFVNFTFFNNKDSRKYKYMKEKKTKMKTRKKKTKIII